LHQAQPEISGPARPVWRIFLGILIILLVGVFAIATYLPSVQRILGDPGAIFMGDDVLRDAARNIANADATLRLRPGDEASHLSRARAYISFGHLEGARAEWDLNHENGSSEWGDIRRTIDEIELKTDEIRSLLHDAETSTNPSEKYPPIYTLLDDISTRFDGIPRYRALFLKGYLLLREGRRAEAQPIFDLELEHYVPLKDYVEYNYARSLMISGNEAPALDAFNKFLHDFPSSRLAPIAHLERINIFRDLDRLEDAIAECSRALDSYPSGDFAAKTLRKWAEIYEGEMDFGNGATKRVELLRNFPDSEEAPDTIDMFFGGVYSLNLLTESDRLVVAYAAIEEHTSDAFEVLSLLAESDSLTAFERARAYHGAGRCEYSYERYYQCIELADKARQIGPGSEWADRAGIRKGHAYWKLDKYNLAEDSFWDVARGHGELASLAAEILAEKAYETSDLSTTREACLYIIDEYPTSDETPQAMTQLAYLAVRDRQFQSAVGYAERCIDAFPDSQAAAEAGFWLAQALDGLGRNNDANEAYTNLAERVPWNYWGIRAREHLGISIDEFNALDPFDFDTNSSSNYSGSLAKAWELYDSGTLDLAESEFILAYYEDLDGAKSGLALTRMEQGQIRMSVVSLRDAAWVGDQAFITPARQRKILIECYPIPYETEVGSASLAHGVPPSWLWGAMRQESCFNPRATSSSGACGLIQIMPGTGRFIADRRGLATFDTTTLYDPTLNTDYAAFYFDYLRDQVRGDRLLDILAAYNAGPGRWSRFRERLPTRDDDIFINAIPLWETRNYSHWVYANIRMYEFVLDMRGYNAIPF